MQIMASQSLSFTGLSSQDQKKEKQRQSVKNSREKEKKYIDNLKTEKESLEKTASYLNSQIAKGQAKNEVWAHVAKTMSQANPGLNNHPGMQAMLNNTSQPKWKSYEPPKSWK